MVSNEHMKVENHLTNLVIHVGESTIIQGKVFKLAQFRLINAGVPEWPNGLEFFRVFLKNGYA